MKAEEFCACNILEALSEIKAGRLVAILDNELGNGSASLVLASPSPNLDALKLMASITQGFVCMAVTETDWGNISLPESLQETCELGAIFPDSAVKRSQSLRIVPIAARKHGVLRRPGHAECVLDLARLSGQSTNCFFSVFTQTGPKLPTAFLEAVQHHSIKVLNVAEVMRHRLSCEPHVRQKGHLPFKSRYGYFDFRCIESDVFGTCGVLVKGDPTEFHSRSPLVRVERIHSLGGMCTSVISCLGRTFDRTLELMYADGRGLVLFVPSIRERSFDELVQVFTLQYFDDDPFSTLEDSCPTRILTAGISAQILHLFGADNVRVISGRPHRIKDLELFGIRIVASISTQT